MAPWSSRGRLRGEPRRSRHQHKYGRLPLSEEISVEAVEPSIDSRTLRASSRLFLVVFVTASLVAITALVVFVSGYATKVPASCDSVALGFACKPEISHFWGQYSPYFSVPSNISAVVPEGCSITFVQVLSRHGARDPTASKTSGYHNMVQQIQKNVKVFDDDYSFLRKYQYRLGADQLTKFGEQEMINSGIKFYGRYKELAERSTPFFRTSGQARVVESAQNFSQGFHQALLADKNAGASAPYPYPITVINENSGSNNTLSHGLCDEFEKGADSSIGDSAQKKWADIFTPPITERLNQNLLGANLTTRQTIYMMDLCPFETVASPTGTISPFCKLFAIDEWHSYDYYQSLGKYYGYGAGNPLGPTQGVGFTNELIARLTNTPVYDDPATSINRTLDTSNTTFPLGMSLYADFSHDNDLTGIFSAMGLYNATKPLSNTSLQTTARTAGYSAAWTVPFAARAYFEKMSCAYYGDGEELVRVIVNDRVVPLQNCGADALGRCKLSRWVASLSFPRQGGDWDHCFARI